MKIHSNRAKRWALVLGLAIGFLILFPVLETVFGPATTILLAVPVVAATWYLGLAAGLVASVLGVFITAAYLIFFVNYDLNMLLYFGLVSRPVILIILVGIVYFLKKRIDEHARVETELRSRERYLALLNELTRTVLQSDGSDSTLREMAIVMVKLVEADECYITRWDEGKQVIVPLIYTSSQDNLNPETELSAEGLSMTTSVMNTGQVHLVKNGSFIPFIHAHAPEGPLERSVMGVPLIAGEKKLGAAILIFHGAGSFTHEEINRAEQAGHQLALALQYYQQGIWVQQHLKEGYALTEIGRALSVTEHTGLNKVLELIVNSARDLILQAEESVIHLLDNEKQVLIARAVSGLSVQDETVPRIQMKLGEGVAGQVIHDGITINIGDVENDPRFIRTTPKLNFKSLLVAPVQSGSQQIGTISVQSAQEFAFNAADVGLLNALGIQAAIAIENTRLFETTQQQLKEVDALYKINQGLVASLDTDQIIKDVVILLHQNFGYYFIQIYIVDPTNGDLILKSGSGGTGNQILEQGFRLSRGAGIVGHVAETGEPFETNDVSKVVFFDRNPFLPETQSELTVPIKIDGKVVGILDIQHTPPNRFTEDELQLMIAVAGQLAVALQKANLYKDLQTALQQEQTIRSQLIQNERLALVGRLLASVSHELNNPMQAIQNVLFLLKDEPHLSAQARQDLDIILSETERMAALIERLRNAYRPVRIEDFRFFDLNSLIEEVHALIATHMRQKKINFDFLPDPELPNFSGLPDQISQVVLNLFLNGIEMMKPGGCLTVQTCSLPDRNAILLTVKDTGPGIEPEILPQIFEPFMTTKNTGTGLGLTISYEIIQQHHGHIEAQNNPQGGAIFIVRFPVNGEGLK